MSEELIHKLQAENAKLKRESETLRARSEAMSAVVFELRTIIVAALGYTKLLIRRNETLNHSVQREALGMLHDSLSQAVRRIASIRSRTQDNSQS